MVSSLLSPSISASDLKYVRNCGYRNTFPSTLTCRRQSPRAECTPKIRVMRSSHSGLDFHVQMFPRCGGGGVRRFSGWEKVMPGFLLSATAALADRWRNRGNGASQESYP